MNINPEGILNVQLDLSDAEAMESETISSTTMDAGISTGKIGNINLSGVSRIGIEHNYYLLDGTRGVSADAPWVSTTVTESGEVSNFSVSVPDTSKEVNHVGFVFDPVTGEHPAIDVSLTITLKDGTSVIYTGEVDSAYWDHELPKFGEIDTINMIIDHWSVPLHRPMLSAVIIGSVFQFDKDDILAFGMDFSGEPLATTVPTASATLEVPNYDHKWSILYPSNYMDEVTKDATMEVTFGYDGYPTTTSKFYMTEWSSIDGASATFTGEGMLSELGQAAPAFTGTYNFEDIVYACLNDFLLDVTPTDVEYEIYSPDVFVVDPSLANRSVTFGDDLDVADMTNADVIQLIGSASMTSDTPCSLIIARNGGAGIVQMTKTGDGYPYTYNESKHFYLDRDNQIAYPEGSYRPKLYAVVVNDDYTTEPYDPAWSSPDGETQTTANDFVTGAYMARYGMLIGDWLSTRKEVTCEFRPDPTVNDYGYQQVDLTVRPLDMVDIQIGDENPYYVGTMQVTEVNLSFDGAWHGTISGIMREKVN